MSLDRRHRGLALLLASLTMLGPFSIDAMFPAFPLMGAQLQVSSAGLQQMISVYLAAFAGMSLLHGPLSDAVGRRPTILVSLAVFVVATLACALSPTFEFLLVCRALQGVSAGAGMIVGRAVIRDRFQGAQAQRMLATVSLIFGIAPALAPIIGGWLVGPIGWRGIFAALDAAAIALWWVCWKTLPETHPRARRGRFSLRALLRIYREVCRDRRFVALAAAAAFNFAALFVYVASAPALILGILHLNEREFAWLFIPLIAGMMIGSVLVNRLSERLSTEIIVRSGYVVVAIGALFNLALSAGWIAPQVPWSVLPFTVLGAGVALAFPALTLLMLDRFPLNRGAAASMQAVTSLGLNALIAGALSPLVSGRLVTLALAATLFSIASFACWLWVHKKLQVTGTMAPVVAHPSGVAPAAEV